MSAGRLAEFLSVYVWHGLSNDTQSKTIDTLLDHLFLTNVAQERSGILHVIFDLVVGELLLWTEVVVWLMKMIASVLLLNSLGQLVGVRLFGVDVVFDLFEGRGCKGGLSAKRG